MNQDAVSANDCPTQEQLAEFFEGGGGSCSDAHVVSCPRCQSTLTAYRLLDQAVQRAADPPTALAERIKQRCAGLSWEQARPATDAWTSRVLALPRWFRPAPRYAVAWAAILVLLFTVAWPLLKSGAPTGGGAVANVPPFTGGASGAQGRVGEAADGPGAAAASWTLYPRDGGNVIDPAGSLSRVGTDGATLSPASATPPEFRARTVVPSRVRHVWMVDDLGQAESMLRASLPATASCAVVEVGPSTASYNVFLSDHRLQGLVDRLASMGFPLVSASVPQPGKGDRLLMTSRTVRYDVEFVRGGVVRPVPGGSENGQ